MHFSIAMVVVPVSVIKQAFVRIAMRCLAQAGAFARGAFRRRYRPSQRGTNLGFRVARSYP